MAGGQSFPEFHQVVLDARDARELAEFYRKLLGYVYREGDEPPTPGEPDKNGNDWLVLRHPSGSGRIAFQQVPDSPRSTWPDQGIPQQLHLDLTVPTVDDLRIQHERALELGATVLQDRSADEVEPLWVYADPAGHPFCIFVATH